MLPRPKDALDLLLAADPRVQPSWIDMTALQRQTALQPYKLLVDKLSLQRVSWTMTVTEIGAQPDPKGFYNVSAKHADSPEAIVSCRVSESQKDVLLTLSKGTTIVAAGRLVINQNLASDRQDATRLTIENAVLSIPAPPAQ